MQDALTLYIPRNPECSNILRGSAIVGDEHGDSTLLIYYEGNQYNAENLRTYEERANCAAGRLMQKYPTVARAVVPTDDFIAVGTIRQTDKSWYVNEICDPIRLEVWIRPELLPQINGSQAFRNRLAAKTFRSLKPNQIFHLQARSQVTGKSLVDLLCDRVLAKTTN